jgi:hypothetical protein
MGFLLSGIVLCFVGGLVFVTSPFSGSATAMLGGFIIAGTFLLVGIPLFIKGVKRV